MSIRNDPGAPPAVSRTAARAYTEQADRILACVDSKMKKSAVVGTFTMKETEMMLQNHRNHIQFMSSFFRLNNTELLKETIIWVYSAYQAHGFPPDYFPEALNRWMEAVGEHLEPEIAEEVNSVYRWMKENHAFFLEASRSRRAADVNGCDAEHPLRNHRAEFLQGLVEGNLPRCHACATEFIKDKSDLKSFYLGVVQPAMVEIGVRWERGVLSVAREHLATAIVTRILATQHMRFFDLHKPKGKALISAAANEFHELGARMVADLLDLDGWDVIYVGSNVPVDEAFDIILSERPFLVGISVTMPFNLGRASDLIARIRQDERISGTNIFVGGRAFQFSPTLWHSLGADVFAKDALEVLEIADSLRRLKAC